MFCKLFFNAAISTPGYTIIVKRYEELCRGAGARSAPHQEPPSFPSEGRKGVGGRLGGESEERLFVISMVFIFVISMAFIF